MDIRKQIDFNLKALDTYGDDEIKSALTWFACARDQIVSASTKGDNLYHQVFIALHEMLKKQIVGHQSRLFHNGKCKENNMKLMTVGTQALLIRVVSYYSVCVLDDVERDDFESYVEETGSWECLEHYRVEYGIYDHLRMMIEWGEIPVLRDSAIRALAIIGGDGEKVDAEEILKCPGVDACRRWRYQGRIIGHISKKSGNLHLTIPGLGTAVERRLDSLFEQMVKVGIKRTTEQGEVFEIEPVELVVVGMQEMDMLTDDGLPCKERLLKIESVILKTDYWGNYPKYHHPNIVTELLPVDHSMHPYLPASIGYKRSILRRYNNGPKVIFDVDAVLSKTEDIGGRFGLRRVIGIANGKVYDFIATKAFVWLDGTSKACNVSINSDEWDMMAAGSNIEEEVVLRARSLVITPCVKDGRPRHEYLDLKWATVVSNGGSAYVENDQVSAGQRRRFPSAAEIMIEQLRRAREEFESVAYGDCRGCDDACDDVREDMGPWTNWPDYD